MAGRKKSYSSPLPPAVCAALFICMIPASVAALDMNWGGHNKIRGRISRPASGSMQEQFDSDAYYDGAYEFRLKSRIGLQERLFFTAHYEMIGLGGDTRRFQSSLRRRTPNDRLLAPGIVTDDHRFLHLTGIIEESEDAVMYHRMDRLYISYQPGWGTLTAGRQALTWGNGFRFNPMDLFNPFSPIDVERDYKIGDDMVHLQAFLPGGNDLQALYVPRRDRDTGNLERASSSFAVKYHGIPGETVFPGEIEPDLLLARHYDQIVLGAGLSGYVKNAAWRTDAVYTAGEGGEDFLAVTANIDYSWIWWTKNLYGFLEFHYTGSGEDDPAAALADSALVERFRRGEIYTLGRYYLAGEVRIEIHPLLNAYGGGIQNLQDGSGVLQLRGVWDAAESVQFTLGGNLYYGGGGTEFGGYALSGFSGEMVPPASVYLWMTHYF